MTLEVSPSSIVVLKYGGTSVGTGARMLSVCDIVKHMADGSQGKQRPVVVLSAMSSYVKAEGTTNRLIEAANAALEGDMKQCNKVLNKVKSSHLVAIHEALGESPAGQSLQELVNEELDQLKGFLEAVAVIGEISPRSNDVIISVGERLSAKLFSAILKETAGIDAVYLSMENIIESSASGNGKQTASPATLPLSSSFMSHAQDQAFYDKLREKMAALVLAALQNPNAVPVVTGFFGFVPGGIVETVGRGYTDFTAALIAAGVKAKELQIWKEVDGIYSADPSKVKSARVLPRISPGEAAELTFYGSEVIHPFTMEQVVRENIPIRIKNTFKPYLAGTVIDPNHFEPISQRGAVAVTVKDNVTVVNLRSNRKLGSHGFLATVFTIMAKFGLSIDMVSTSEVDVSMTLAKTKNLEQALAELQAIGTISVQTSLAILSLVGQRMKATVGVSGSMFTTLAKNGINIEMISQGASEINISCVIDRKQALLAMQCVHDELIIAANMDEWKGCNDVPSTTVVTAVDGAISG